MVSFGTFISLLLLAYVHANNPNDCHWCHCNDDPHMKSFDNYYYEFHRSGSYVLFTDRSDITVIAGFSPCNIGSHVRCSCGLRFRFHNTVLRYDRCGVAPVPAIMKFFADTDPNLPPIEVDCSASVISPADETNDAWWTAAGNGVDVNGQIKCARIGSTNTYIMRTLSGNNDADVYVKGSLHDYGVFSIQVGIKNHYQSANIGGLCGTLNGNQNDDFFTDNGVFDPNDPSDFNVVADFWSVKYPSNNAFDLLDDLSCPCDNIGREGGNRKRNDGFDVRYSCQVPIAQCTLEQLGEPVVLQEEVRDVQGKEMRIEEAEKQCHEFAKRLRELLALGLLERDEFKEFIKLCTLDLQATGDLFWAEAALKFFIDKAKTRGENENPDSRN